MDAITDLTAEAVTYLVLAKDILANTPCQENGATLDFENHFAALSNNIASSISAPGGTAMFDPGPYSDRFNEIFWYSADLHQDQITKKCLIRISNLLGWMDKCFNINKKSGPSVGPSGSGWFLDSSPFELRTALREKLYTDTRIRLTLVGELQYMPLQILYALDVKPYSLYGQRMLQVWKYSPNEKIFCDKDEQTYLAWWAEEKKAKAAKLLSNLSLVCQDLLDGNYALPFESFFGEELAEIMESRTKRGVSSNTGTGVGNVNPAGTDPLDLSARIELRGLALSGGGIRSATFSLGVIQQLAELDALPKIDYMSTVSGGGYIGSWLVSWIKRAGSLSKVIASLDSRRSSDPMADEVRPIRWLRMYSNYLTPRSGFMSDDSWTTGMTWLRNTLINQFLLLLLVAAVISIPVLVFDVWQWFVSSHILFISPITQGILAGFILLGIGLWLPGAGMNTYREARKPGNLQKLGEHKHLAAGLTIWAFFSAILTANAFTDPNNCPHTFSAALIILWPVGVMAAAAMVIIAIVGGYYETKNGSTNQVWLAIISSSAIAAVVGTLALAGVWQLIEQMAEHDHWIVNPFYKGKGIWDISDLSVKSTFIIGVPLVIEVISLTVVFRMLLMGSLFPDEKREWWGKMGGIIHRAILIWILVTFGVLLLPEIYRVNIDWRQLLSVIGGWTVLVNVAANTAFHSKDDKKEAGSTFGKVKAMFISIAPYLFIIGFCLIASYGLRLLYHITPVDSSGKLVVLSHLRVTVLLAVIVGWLSWCIGVNDFSLHYFYRNRLIRAYLGASRRRTDRDKTFNKFTKFDRNDDLHLREFLSQSNYDGPYPIINTALNATVSSDLDRQDRMAESFIFSPLYCGYDFSPTRSASTRKAGGYQYGYRRTSEFSAIGGPGIGTAMSISGAAANPNMGYHSSPVTAFLLTVFNIRLGWWIGNPARSKWRSEDPAFGLGYLIDDLIGNSSTTSDFVCLSDGGHFDNMGLYELIRRKCAKIILVDAEQDETSACEGLANAIRRCRIDFGVEIRFDPANVQNSCPDGHWKSGDIIYPGKNVPAGKILHIKPVVHGNEPVDITQYKKVNAIFPQQSTGDQFFDESQFESYRKLGYLSVNASALKAIVF